MKCSSRCFSATSFGTSLVRDRRWFARQRPWLGLLGRSTVRRISDQMICTLPSAHGPATGVENYALPSGPDTIGRRAAGRLGDFCGRAQRCTSPIFPVCDSGRASADQVCRALGDHDRGGVGVPAGDDGHDRRVHGAGSRVDRARRTLSAEAAPAWAASDDRVMVVLVSRRAGNVTHDAQWCTLRDQVRSDAPAPPHAPRALRHSSRVTSARLLSARNRAVPSRAPETLAPDDGRVSG